MNGQLQTKLSAFESDSIIWQLQHSTAQTVSNKALMEDNN